MTQQARPNPIEAFDAATKRARQTVAGVKPAQLTSPTPCSEWNVQALLDHMVGTLNFVASSLSGTPSTKAAGSLQAFDAGVAAVSKAARVPGVLEKKVKSPMGEMPGQVFLMIGISDTLIHGWDLAKATGQDTKLDPKNVELVHGFMSMQAEAARKRKALGPEVKVPEHASAQDKLMGMVGRKP
ncbi:MAG: TIGR03086 family protein [Chloroflexi bacterium]|nr:TIGR03086 family protein [Chloroflexota bacterium]